MSSIDVSVDDITVTVATTGPAGPQGGPGPVGPSGPAGADADSMLLILNQGDPIPAGTTYPMVIVYRES